MAAEKLAFRWCEVKAQLGFSQHFGALFVRVLLHGLADPSNSFLQIGGGSEEVGLRHIFFVRLVCHLVRPEARPGSSLLLRFCPFQHLVEFALGAGGGYLSAASSSKPSAFPAALLLYGILHVFC
jgi:hypothetical protein